MYIYHNTLAAQYLAVFSSVERPWVQVKHPNHLFLKFLLVGVSVRVTVAALLFTCGDL